MSAEPFLRWCGGKRSFTQELAPVIKNYLDTTGGRYYEPFLGGGAMALHLALPNMVLGDALEDLMRTYRALKESPVELATLLYELAGWGSEESHYYAVRASEPDTDVEAGARLIYLNAHCFNGIWRMNKSGKMNVPYGKKADRITDSLLERIGAAHEAIKDSDFCLGDFERTIKSAEGGDLLYIDPPYSGTYVNYSPEGFCGVTQKRLAAVLFDAHQRGVVFLAHNSDTPEVRECYRNFTFIPTKESRSVNRDGEGRSKVKCLIITNMDA